MNQIPVLDKGFIALSSTSMNKKEMDETRNRLFRGLKHEGLRDVCQVHILIKSPLFVKLSLLSTRIVCLDAHSTGEPEAWLPAINEVNAKDLKTSELIAGDLAQTTEALLLNPKSYTLDGCDMYVAQSITPISVYSTYLASGSLTDWLQYINKDNFPSPVRVYCNAIKDVILAEWPDLREQLNGKKEKRRR
jgi:hypothetical protein